MQTIQDLVAAIRPLDQHKQALAAAHIDGLVKPLNSLGRLETLAIQLAGMPGLTRLDNLQKEIVVMCADHGVYDEGVAISPQQVTHLQALNMLKGTSGVCVLAKSNGASVLPVDIGIDCEPIDGMLSLKVGRKSGNIARGPAMSRSEAEHLLLRSAQLVPTRAAEGIAVFGTGELGMANTTPASAIISVLCGCDPHEVVGIGANLPAERMAHKEAMVRQAIEVNQPNSADGIDVLAKVGGYDLVGMTGVILGAGSCGLPVVLDGFLSYAAAIAACQIAPEVKNYCIPSHFSAEKGSQRALEHLGLTPYLYLDLRLGEGSGAALAMSIVSAAGAMYCEMGVLAESGISLKA
ncbi:MULTISPECIES: nicotinate-nucleotide--dimethylbenzimidazole phosphoribosyltransferase [unclassified Leclercia]|uniref:Nicotinate-nucleotide--dimethylbenzimidazole phosphoribosyltransferase n=1 Tax=Leclercia barmai TaxID=2785629 RepID=A0ABS7RVL1_9ENTR|nr:MULTISPECIES: nicotinate-nucleotide--dimethylbenzimidazole phosphoribosyltransferase [unclassified Leclercia]MBZ0058335.1 nicotinate-nucleotide--dimethylbenzimidazole phosphoribosyltransferase [Leclercia sp. EMC7]MCM5696545.1 nicotinate-nucleotide--dimethylbenzimidazole phosphoribosyltransferase [Leclercia sp. LTM01]MCM5700893.1 nicotinate-nucleotide--dimethylbenzimidazole phosphoribosyltransferase [Leclercia sp. LTM14]